MTFSSLPSLCRQQLVLDFSSLREDCPEGLYLSLTPGLPSLWIAVLFVSKGPYEGAILRFQISFPDSYPHLPPLVTFSSDIFHPLVVPLTTYTFSSNAVDTSTTVSASDEDRLPPGAFTLRHGFPWWFSPASVLETTSDMSGTDDGRLSIPGNQEANNPNTTEDFQKKDEPLDRKALILSVFKHIQDAFENEDLLDKIPLDAVGDPSAWHAWRAYRGLARHQTDRKSPDPQTEDATPSSPKNPGEWKWDGVWESRVNNSIEASISEAALFGNPGGGPRAGSIQLDSTTMDPHRRMLAAADRQIRFSKLSQERFDELKGEIYH